MTSRPPGYGISRSNDSGGDKSPSRRRSSRRRAATNIFDIGCATRRQRRRFDANFRPGGAGPLRSPRPEVAPTRERSASNSSSTTMCVTRDVIITPRRLRPRCNSVNGSTVKADVSTCACEGAKVPVRYTPVTGVQTTTGGNGVRPDLFPALIDL